MAKDWQIKKRRPVRRKHIAPLLKDLEEALGIDLAVDGAFLEMADYGPWKMVLVDRVPLAVELLSPEDERVVFLTLRGFLAHPCEKRYVEVDHGAIPFLMKGADCMVAGVHGAQLLPDPGQPRIPFHHRLFLWRYRLWKSVYEVDSRMPLYLPRNLFP